MGGTVMSQVRVDGSYGANPAENYERFFVPSIGEPLARDLVNHARIRPTDRVLDVACGTGIVVRLASQGVNAPGDLAGLDPNAAMLAAARGATPAQAAIAWYEASAEKMPLPDDSFDVVLCQMGLQFMADQPAAVGEMWRVLADGGRLLLSVPGPISGVFAELAAAMGRHIGPQAAAFVSQVFSLHDIDQVERLLHGAAFCDVAVAATIHELELPPPHEFLWQYIHSTPLVGVVSQASAESQSAMEREVLAAWTDYVRDDVLKHELRLVMATGGKTAP
jgi:ubiquinone/menaquinone biosynthesis C-methylase UbiE